MEREKIEIDFNGPEGNVFFILGRVAQALKKQGRQDDGKKLWDKITKDTYSQALVEINKYVELVDTGKPKTLKNYLKQGEING